MDFFFRSISTTVCRVQLNQGHRNNFYCHFLFVHRKLMNRQKGNLLIYFWSSSHYLLFPIPFCIMPKIFELFFTSFNKLSVCFMLFSPFYVLRHEIAALEYRFSAVAVAMSSWGQWNKKRAIILKKWINFLTEIKFVKLLVNTASNWEFMERHWNFRVCVLLCGNAFFMPWCLLL